MTKEKIQDYTLRISSANKTEMVVVLYDIAITYLEDAVSKLEAKDVKGFRLEINRVRNTIRELINSLDTSIDIGQNLLSLYIFCNKELTKAYLDKEKESINHVMNILVKLREAYDTISKMDQSGSVMKHAENVYSGFTYNKNLLNEDVSDRASNRGFLA